MSQPPSLYRSLSKSFILTSVVPLLLLGLVILHYLLVTSTEEINGKNQLLARVLSSHVKAELSSPVAILNDLSSQLEMDQTAGAEETLQQLLNQHVISDTYFDSIYLLSPAGLVTAVGLSPQRVGLRPDFIGLDLSHLDFYREAIQSGIAVWSDIFPSLITGNRSFAICIPLVDGRAIIGNIRIDFLQILTQKIDRGQSVEVSILDHHGEMIAFSDPQWVNHSRNLSHLLLIQQGLSGIEGSALYVENNISHLGSISIIDGPGWLTLVSQPTVNAYQAVGNAGILFGFGLLVAIALAMLLAMFKAKKIAQPFRELSQQAEAISGGEYDLSALTSDYLEVSSLIESFHSMAAAIRDRENALSQSERDYRTLTENLPAIVYRILIQDNRRLMLMDTYQEKMTGFTIDEVIAGGTSFFSERIHPDDFPYSRGQISDAIARREPYTIEYRFCHKEGHYRNFIERGTPVFDERDELLYLDGVIFDDTEQHRAKEILLQTEKMMSVGGLAAGIAHEINNPLASILLNIELIQQRLDLGRAANCKRAKECGTDLNRIIQFLQKSKIDNMHDAIAEASRRTAKIVENVLSFSRKGKGNFTEVPVIELIEQTLQLAEHDFDLKKSFDFRKIKISRNYARSLPDILCEPNHIQQVLLNILENAAQAMFLETASIREPAITISARKNGEFLCLEISDNGPGMKESVRRRIFEPFFTTKEAGRGTGLGLSVSYFIVNKYHQGTMSVEAIPGVGSTFSIHLPYRHTAYMQIKQL